jgi:pyrroloquinoline quinone biosynthesis protein B
VLRAIVLGAAAGGGFPQWNSNAPACRRARAGDNQARRRTQASLAVSGDNVHWFLINASPDLRQQIEATDALVPNGAARSSPIAGVLLTNADVDAIAGLLHMRERQPFAVYATEPVMAILKDNPIFDVLAPDCVTRTTVSLDHPFELAGPDGRGSGVVAELFDVPGKVALFMEGGRNVEHLASKPGGTVGVELRAPAGDGRLCYVPGCAAMTNAMRARFKGAPLVLFDGTLWSDDEMIRLGLGAKTGQRMGHMSVSGADGTMAAFRDLAVGRKVFVHINNSNPILLEDSPEHAEVRAAGWEVGYDGMDLVL